MRQSDEISGSALALGGASMVGHFDFDPVGAEAGEIPLPTGDVAKSQLVERRVRAALERDLGIEEQRVNVLIDLAEPRERWRQLGHGFRVEPSIVLWESDDALRVPFSALFRDGEDWAVFVASAGRAELRRVKIGRQNGLEAEAISGLEPGERVVIHPSDRVENGARLRERS